jgi:hypothetical protein
MLKSKSPPRAGASPISVNLSQEYLNNRKKRRGKLLLVK